MNDFFEDQWGRPTHPDFWQLADAVLQQDGQAVEERRPIPDILAEFVDPETITFFVNQRAGTAVQRLGLEDTPENRAMLGGAILDGFVLGARFERKRAAADGT